MSALEFDICISKPYFLLPLVPFPSFSMLLNFSTILHTVCSRISTTIIMKCGCNIFFARFGFFHIDVICHIIYLYEFLHQSIHQLLFFKDSYHTLWYSVMLIFKFCWFLLPKSIHDILTQLLISMASFLLMISGIITKWKLLQNNVSIFEEVIKKFSKWKMWEIAAIISKKTVKMMQNKISRAW